MKKALLFSLLLASSSAFATQNKIMMPGGTIGSNEQLSVSLDQLTPENHFTIKCAIKTTATENASMKFATKLSDGAKISGTTLNGVEFDWDNAKLDASADNIISADYLAQGKDNSLLFTNTTSDSTLTVSYCEAEKVATESEEATDTNKDSADNSNETDQPSNTTNSTDQPADSTSSTDEPADTTANSHDSSTNTSEDTAAKNQSNAETDDSSQNTSDDKSASTETNATTDSNQSSDQDKADTTENQ